MTQNIKNKSIKGLQEKVLLKGRYLSYKHWGILFIVFISVSYSSSPQQNKLGRASELKNQTDSVSYFHS